MRSRKFKFNNFFCLLVKCLHIWFEKDYVADEEWIQSVLHLTNNRIYKLHFKNINFTDDSAIRLLNSIPICIETLIIQIRNDFKQLSTFLNASELFSCLCIKKDDIISLLYSGRKTNTNVDKIEKDTKIVRCSCIGLEENQFLQLLDPGQSVQKLCLINALNLSKNALDCISKMQHLNYLEITKADLISDQDWSTPFESGFKMLQSIKILDCKGFSDRSIVSLSNKSLLKEVEMELLHCIDTDVISRSLSEFRLNKLSLHIRAESLDLLDSFIYFNHPTELFILTIYPPYSPSNYFNLTKKIKNLSELFQKVGLKFDFHINYTAIKFKIK